MDLLLQAAKVLESENSGINSDRTTSRSTRGSHLYGGVKGRGDARVEPKSRTFSSSSITLDDGADATEEESGLAGERRRAGGSGTREVHNQLEKNRRKQMRECFSQLQQCIPSLENKRVATHSILQGAIKHIKNLKKKDVEQEREIQMLAKRKSELKKKYDIEFNKCSVEVQRKAAEARMKVENVAGRSAFDDEDDDEDDDGNATDSTSTASEGPDNEQNFSDEEKMDSAEKPQISRVNPIVAAKLDGLRKRKLATLDHYPKQSDYIIASMKDPGYLQATTSKHKAVPLSSVSSSSVALKNMLEQKKKQQSGLTPSLVSGQPCILEPSRTKVIPATTRLPSSKGASSLTSSHPMISNQLAAATSIPLAISNSSILANMAGPIYRSAPVAANSIESNLSPLKNRTPAVLSLTSLQNKMRALESDNKNTQQVVFSPTSVNSILSAVLPRSAGVPEISNSQPLPRTGMSSVTAASEPVDGRSKGEASFMNSGKSPPVVTGPVNFLVDSSGAGSKSSAGQTTTIPNHSSASPIIASSQSASPASSKVVPVFPLSLIQGLALNHSTTSVAVTLPSSSIAPPSNTVVSAISPILTPKIHPEILIASPVKADTSSSAVNPGIGRVTTLLAAASQANATGVIKPNAAFVSSLSATSIASSAVTPSIATTPAAITLPETLKTVALTPTILPFTVTAGPLPATTSSIAPGGAPLRFFTPLTPSSVVTAPLPNGQTSLMPAVVQLDSSGQMTLLQNFVHLQTPQVLAQPIVVVTAPNSIIAPATSSTGSFNVTNSSSSSASSL